MLYRNLILAGASLLGAMSVAHAAPITNFQESLSTPITPTGAVLTPITLTGIAAPSNSTITTPNYTITFSNVIAGEGVVQGTTANLHATPVAGSSGGAPTYMTDGFGSPTTTSLAASGNYLSTGGAGSTITITFATPQTSLALLWGSIDSVNQIALSGGSIVGTDTLTGAQVQNIPNFAGNGNEGVNGSAYVSLTDTPFTTVTLSSGTFSFEAAAIAGSNAPFNSVPEPMTLALLGTSLAGLGMVRKFRG